MTRKELMDLLVQFTNEHYATRDAQPFFRILHQISLKGLGVGIGGNVDRSGERMAMAFVQGELSRRCSGERWNIFDVGANVGAFTAAAMGVFGSDRGRYFCFEPSKTAFGKLQTALGANACVELFNHAFSDIAEESRLLFADKAGSILSSLYSRRLEHAGVSMTQTEVVSTRTIDEFCREKGIERIHFLKLDVEGHELKCLEGARGMIDGGRINFIQFEFGGCHIDSRTYFRDFWYALKNYRIGRILRDGAAEIEAYGECEEMFLPQNYLAWLR